jgi:hypothetical protein
MGKSGRLRTLAQRKEFFLKFAATFAAIIGIASAGFTITGNYIGAAATAILVLVILIISGLVHLNKLIIPQVAVDDILASNVDVDLRTGLHCPCSLELASEAKRLARSCFVGSVSIEPDTYEQLRVKNPNILACLTDHDGIFLGYFDVIPLKETFARSFLQGLVTEMQITHEHVLSPDEIKSCKYLFISGLAVENPNVHVGRRSASILVWALLKYLDRYYVSVKPMVFAVAAKNAGEELLQRFKLTLRSKGRERLDKYDLYSIMLTHEQIAKRLACLPDWSKLCTLDWSRKSRVVGTRRTKRPHRPAPPKTRAWALNSRRGTSLTSRR